MNINEIKKQLSEWGVSSSTPGLNGDDRFEELKHRYEMRAQKVAQIDVLGGHQGPQGAQDGAGAGAVGTNEAFAVPSLNNLSIGEIRSRLSALGENTNTPGVTGQERRSVLMQRLIEAICGAEEEDLDAISSTQPIQPAQSHHDLVAPPPQVKPEPEQSPKFDIAAAHTRISSMKKELKRLQNQRAIFVASRLSGGSQDEELRFCESKVGKLDTELGFYKLMLQKGERMMNAPIKSEFLVLNQTATSFQTEALIYKLEGYRNETKELVRK
jgi:hypothetical protein